MKTAKELFWEYYCNHFYLDHDGMTNEYITLGGNDPLKEKEWRDEYIQYWMGRIDDNEIEAYQRLSYAEAIEILGQLSKKTNFKDDYSKFWYAFQLKNIASKPSVNKIDKIEANQKAFKIFTQLSISKINLSDESRKLITKEMINAMNTDNVEDYITNYSKRLLQKK